MKGFGIARSMPPSPLAAFHGAEHPSRRCVRSKPRRMTLGRHHWPATHNVPLKLWLLCGGMAPVRAPCFKRTRATATRPLLVMPEKASLPASACGTRSIKAEPGRGSACDFSRPLIRFGRRGFPCWSLRSHSVLSRRSSAVRSGEPMSRSHQHPAQRRAE